MVDHVARMARIDDFLPRPRLRQIDRVAVAAGAAAAWKAARSIDLYGHGIARTLFGLRDVPTQIGALLRGRAPSAPPPSMTIDDVIAGESFRLLAEEPGREIVVGAIGKVWRPRIPFVDVAPDSFARFAEPGFIKVAWSIAALPREGGGAWVAVDLRVDATDDAAWRRFRPYWAVIGPFSHAIRHGALRAIARELGEPIARDADRALPGDDLLPGASTSWTDAVTIEAPPSKVWPWLVQMGCRRAGWYSYDRLDNGGVPSADRIVPELQHVAVGDRLPATPKGDVGFAVLRVDPPHALVLGSPSLLPDAPRVEPSPMTWAFALQPIGDDATRLVVRVRGDFVRGARAQLQRAVLRPVHAVMEHEQLRNVKRRAERAVAA